MAFKKTPPKSAVPDSPEQILLDLPRRKIPGVLLHQREVLSCLPQFGRRRTGRCAPTPDRQRKNSSAFWWRNGDGGRSVNALYL
jgi:hypothetical protein